MFERKTKRRAIAMLGATAVGIAALFGAGTAANAVTQGTGDIDFDRQGSLTVHKYKHQTGSTLGDISQAPEAGDYTGAIEGVTFTAYLLQAIGAPGPVDLSVASSWTGLKDLKAGAGCIAPAGYKTFTEAGIPLPKTDANGSAAVSLDIGLYMVCETAAPAAVVDRAAPFIMTVPMPHEKGWVYDVHAYPKNGTGEIGKTIEDQGSNTGLGSVVKFPVTVPVPRSESEWTGFAIRDTLDSRLTPVAGSEVAVLVDDAALDSSYYTLTVVGQVVTMKFTDAGLNWLNATKNGQAGKVISVIFAGTVTSLTGDTGTIPGAIPNTAEFWPNNPGLDTTVRPPITSPEVITNWGSLQVEKRSAGTGTDGSGGALLDGAVFEVYNAVAPYADSCDDAVQTGSALTVQGKTAFTSGDPVTGIVSIPGLFVSDSKNVKVDATQRCYVLKETVAPAGYVLPVNPYTAVTVKIGETAVVENGPIINTQQEVPELPLTGAAGQVLLIAGGAGALAVVVGLVLMNRRRESAARI